MSRDKKVGIFVAFGIAILVVVVFLIGDNRRIWDSKVTYTTTFKDAAGLKSGAPVRMGGVDIGLVTRVGYSSDEKDTLIHVSMSVSKEEAIRIREDTVAKVANKGLLGDKMIELTVSTTGAPQLDPKKPMKSEEPLDLAQYLSKFGEIARKAESAVDNVEKATRGFADPQFSDDVKTSVHDLRVVMDALTTQDSVAHRLLFDAEEARKVEAILSNTQAATANLNAASADARDVTRQIKTGPGLAHALLFDGELSSHAAGSLEELHKDLEAIRKGNGLAHMIIYGDADQQHIMTNVNAMTDDLRVIVANLRAGKGTLGALLVDPSLYEDVKSLVGNVDRNQVLRALVRYSIKTDEERGAVRSVQVVDPRPDGK
jgi:phospholipid/cholesterol/gamma-HCH transport system substrate-binding protein